MRRAAFVAFILAAITLLSSLGSRPPSTTIELEPKETTEIALTPVSVTVAPVVVVAEREPTKEESEETPPPSSRYSEIEISDSDVEILACLVWHEARGEPFEGQVAVVEVVFNRILSPSFPDTVEEVVFQKLGEYWQFSPAPVLFIATPAAEQYEAVAAAISDEEYITDADVVFFSTGAYNNKVFAVIGNHVFCRE